MVERNNIQLSLKDLKKQLPCAVYLNGEYETKDLYAGVPVIIGSNGVEKVVELKLSETEKKSFKKFKRQSKNIYVKVHFIFNKRLVAKKNK